MGCCFVFSVDARELYQMIVFGNEALTNDAYLVDKEEALNLLPTSVSEIWVAPFEIMNLIELDFSRFQNLETLVFGKRSANGIELIEVSGLVNLEHIIVGNHSFCEESGCCRITNCPSLQTIQIGDESFVDYESFEVSGLPSLYCIQIGLSAFEFAESLQLMSLLVWVS